MASLVGVSQSWYSRWEGQSSPGRIAPPAFADTTDLLRIIAALGVPLNEWKRMVSSVERGSDPILVARRWVDRQQKTHAVRTRR